MKRVAIELVALAASFAQLPGVALLLYGSLGLLVRVVEEMGWDVPLHVAWLLFIAPGYLLYQSGLRAPLVEAGGGLVWMTSLGLFALFVLPGLLLVVGSRMLRIGLSHERSRGQDEH